MNTLGNPTNVYGVWKDYTFGANLLGTADLPQLLE
jgi:hypothetical protein